uniref:DNA/RNA non-specific endonuclease/pyrophosphatase/phosphodiesterase domain-containing protein n=1 Tax=Dendroctonus ponderosae TaxID=77166 RepID=A0AAR5P8W6_DENPD
KIRVKLHSTFDFRKLLTLILVSYFCHSAIGAVVPEYTNASVENAAVACEINPFEGANPTPLLVRSTSFVYPSSVGRRTITLAAGETVDFACPGGRLVLEGVSTTLQVATASCVSGVRFVVNNARYLWRQIQCSVNPVTTARLTGNSCESNGREAEIGFAVTTSRFVRTIQICFNQATQSPIYTYYDLIPAITQQVRGRLDIQRRKSLGQKLLIHQNASFCVDLLIHYVFLFIGTSAGTTRPSWTQGTGIFTLTNVNNLFTQATQRVTINALLGLPTGSFNVIQNNNNYFLSRGHLTATSDFFYAAQQNSTFQFLNALPQWQTFNGFNWDQAET